jgi:4-hydroxybenzoate polyprenyltransferase
MNSTVRAYVDLTRAHFAFAWPLLFCSGTFLALSAYGGFSWSLVIRAALIGLFGFEAGLVLNDYVDRVLDRRDVEKDRLTGYWRLFGTRPLPEGLIPETHALILFLALAGLTSALILTLPFPHSCYVLILMAYAYVVEYSYQVIKRRQSLPTAQLVGRTDFALFPVAGYLAAGTPDITAILFFAFFYPFAMAHLGVNDLVDLKNDLARGMKSVTVLYGESGTFRWIALFTLAHILLAVVFLTRLGMVAWIGFAAGFLLLITALWMIRKEIGPVSALRALPLFHVTMILYSLSILLDSVL